MKLNKTETILVTFIFLISVFGRNLTGLYIFNYRIGEFIIAFLFVALHVFAFIEKNSVYKKIYIILLSIFYLKFFSVVFILDNLLLFRFSSSIWVIAFFIIGQRVNINKYNFLVINFTALVVLYFLNYINYPDPIRGYFIQNSDKFDFTKPSDLFLIFAVTIFLIYKLFKLKFFILSYALLSILYLPIFYYQSRGSLIAYIFLSTLFITDILNNKIVINLYKIIFFLFISLLIPVSFFISNLENINTFDNVVTTNNFSINLEQKNFPDAMFYIDSPLIKSVDENINWRLSIWQNTLLDIKKSNQILFGNPINDPIPIMNHPYYKTIKLENYNLHNFLIQFFAYFGIIGTSVLVYFYYNIVKSYINNNKIVDILILILPVILVSSFDSSMESVRFPVIFYFSLGLVSKKNFFK